VPALAAIRHRMQTYRSSTEDVPCRLCATILQPANIYSGARTADGLVGACVCSFPPSKHLALPRRSTSSLPCMRRKNPTVALTSLSVLHLPVDEARPSFVECRFDDEPAIIATNAKANYFLSVGTVPDLPAGSAEMISMAWFGRDQSTRPAEITDGLCMTVRRGERRVEGVRP